MKDPEHVKTIVSLVFLPMAISMIVMYLILVRQGWSRAAALAMTARRLLPLLAAVLVIGPTYIWENCPEWVIWAGMCIAALICIPLTLALHRYVKKNTPASSPHSTEDATP